LLQLSAFTERRSRKLVYLSSQTSPAVSNM
jgi:hypothetical protein